MRLLAISLCAFFMLSAPARADQLQDGKATLDRKDYPTALKTLLPLADQGNAEAQYDVGWMYQTGRGVKRDFAEAAKWYRKSAEQGNIAAQEWLGRMYGIGSGVKQDDAEAMRWYRMAADQWSARGMNELGWRYEYGRGIKQDWAEAYFWYSLQAIAYDRQQRRDFDRTVVEYSFKVFGLIYYEVSGKDRWLGNENKAALHLSPEQKAAADRRVEEWVKAHPATAAAEKTDD